MRRRLLVLAALCTVVTIWVPVAGKASPQRQVSGSAPPPAAVQMATRLGIHGHPLVGNQPEGNQGPWAIWWHQLRLTLRSRSSATQSGGRILTAGPLGALGAFHFYAVPANAYRRDPYRGFPVTRAKALAIARQWLDRAGVPLPGTPPSVRRIGGRGQTVSTIIGGTGLCCFTAMAVVSDGATVWIADGGRVVQVDHPGGPTVPPRCRDAIELAGGVRIGHRCFDYAEIAALTMTVDLGGHSPWLDDPAQVAQVFAFGAGLLARPDGPPLRLLRRTSRRAVYEVKHGGTTYLITLDAAFPGMRYGVWQVVNLEPS